MHTFVVTVSAFSEAMLADIMHLNTAAATTTVIVRE